MLPAAVGQSHAMCMLLLVRVEAPTNLVVSDTSTDPKFRHHCSNFQHECLCKALCMTTPFQLLLPLSDAAGYHTVCLSEETAMSWCDLCRLRMCMTFSVKGGI